MTIPKDYKLPMQEKPTFELLPEDTYEVEITDIELKTDVPVYMKPDEVEDKFNFEFTIVDEGEFKGRKQWKEVRTAMSAGSDGYDPSWLYRIFCAVNNVKLSDDEASSVSATSINDMVGKRLRILVIQKANKKGDMGNRVANVLPSKTQVDPADMNDILDDSSDYGVDVDGIPF